MLSMANFQEMLRTSRHWKHGATLVSVSMLYWMNFKLRNAGENTEESPDLKNFKIKNYKELYRSYAWLLTQEIEGYFLKY